MPVFTGLSAATLDGLNNARAALLGVADASPYQPGQSSHAAAAPAALRAASALFAGQVGQMDFDTGHVLPPPGPHLVDCGDVPTDPADASGNRQRIEAAVRRILQAGAVPVVLGGDDSVPIPVARAFEGRGPFTVLQVDAHVDWGDVIRDNPYGYGSPMRRMSEMPWITGMVQVGIRGLGSGEAWQIKDAQAWGSHLIPSRDLHRHGVDCALSHIAADTKVIISIDCDGLDPSVLPAVNMPTPGGLTYEDMIGLLHGVRGRIAGFILTEYVPHRDDPHRLSGLAAARLVSVALGLIAHENI